MKLDVLQLFQMLFLKCVVSFMFLCMNVCPSNNGDSVESASSQSTPENAFFLPPTVVVGIQIRNKAHSLPYLLGSLERLNYPKSRIGLVVHLDHCEDNSAEILSSWLQNVEADYHSVNVTMEPFQGRYKGENRATDWARERYEKLTAVKQEALQHARRSWADYLLMLDADVMTVNEDILQLLMQNKVPIVAPLLKCTNLDSYSNFWGAMTEQGYYKRSDDYFDIQGRQKIGVFPVPMVHSIYLVDLNLDTTNKLSYVPDNDSQTPYDDIIIFAKSVEASKLQMFVDNRHLYGYFSSPVDDGDLNREIEVFQHLKFQIMLDREDLPDIYTLKTSRFLKEVLPPKSKLGFDEIYLVNLKRREDRLAKMMYLLDQQGISSRYFEAVDGKKLNKTYLDSLNISQLPGYSDPYHNRDLKMGEIGCFLSHYFIWEDMIARDYDRILIFEDDIRFGPGFNRGLKLILNEASIYQPNWEIFYIGRKRMSNKEKFVFPGSSIVHPDYTYWTLGYMLTRTGAHKLLAQRPLEKMLAVDEYLPIMFDRHPRDDWKANFEPRDLVAISSEPLLLEPTHYTGEPNYVSDTEDSVIVENKTLANGQ